MLSFGAKAAGAKAGNFILDHQPSSALNETAGSPGMGFPHSTQCSSRQRAAVRAAKRARPQSLNWLWRKS